MMATSLYASIGKRIFDLGATLSGLFLLAPLLVFLMIVVRIKHGAPVIFHQHRPGVRGQPFLIYKFRTMTDARDMAGNLMPDSQRLTRLGRLLRSTSLDELPELFNVLKGDMSLVGPRPLLMRYLPFYTPEQARRHEVKPGITGWAQVNGRNAITWDEKFKLDVWYVDHQSFWLDIKIIFITIWKILKREGISVADHATMPEFFNNRTMP